MLTRGLDTMNKTRLPALLLAVVLALCLLPTAALAVEPDFDTEETIWLYVGQRFTNQNREPFDVMIPADKSFQRDKCEVIWGELPPGIEIGVDPYSFYYGYLFFGHDSDGYSGITLTEEGTWTAYIRIPFFTKTLDYSGYPKYTPTGEAIVHKVTFIVEDPAKTDLHADSTRVIWLKPGVEVEGRSVVAPDEEPKDEDIAFPLPDAAWEYSVKYDHYTAHTQLDEYNNYLGELPPGLKYNVYYGSGYIGNGGVVDPDPGSAAYRYNYNGTPTASGTYTLYFRVKPGIRTEHHFKAFTHKVIFIVSDTPPAELRDLWIDGVQVSLTSAPDVTGDGAFSYDDTTKTLTVHKSYEQTWSGSLITSQIDGLTIRVDNDVTLTGKTGCLSLQKDTTITGPGSLTLTATDQAVAVQNGATLTVDGITVNAEGGKYGFHGDAGGERLVITDGELYATGGTAAISGFSGGVSVPWDYGVTEPEGGVVKNGGVEDSEGNLVKEAAIRRVLFDLKIDGSYVSVTNMDDVLGDGMFSFDGDKTLHLRGGTHTYDFTILESRIPGLTIAVDSDTTLEMGEFAMGYPIFLGADTVITGPGKLTLRAVGFSSGLEHSYGGTLTLKDLDLTVFGGNSGINGSGSMYPGKLVVDHSAVTVTINNTWNTAVSGFVDGIELVDCELRTPEGGKIKDGGIVNADESLTDTVEIVPLLRLEIEDVTDSVMKFRLSNVPDTGDTLRFVAVSYDAEGKQLGASVLTVTAAGEDITGQLEVTPGAAAYKLFLTDESFRPIASDARL